MIVIDEQWAYYNIGKFQIFRLVAFLPPIFSAILKNSFKGAKNSI